MSTRPVSICPAAPCSISPVTSQVNVVGSASDGNALTTGRQALLVLAHLRSGDTYTRLAAGFRVGIATAYRYIHEAVDLWPLSRPRWNRS
ncbi:transposase family protein [Streptomyces sp. NPDC058103]|uniref:helix-turn-helix domain-containing protein n=1 Tax=Streptomyces sp. NPDC058103 TaxID=3346341 RepID=UPI0036EFBE73